jgi:hypothetical protein
MMMMKRVLARGMETFLASKNEKKTEKGEHL